MRLCSADGAEFARALINYSSEEVDAAKVWSVDVHVCMFVCRPLVELPGLASPRLFEPGSLGPAPSPPAFTRAGARVVTCAYTCIRIRIRS